MAVVSAVGVPGPPRLAVIAGRQVGTAVARNRAKRRLREAAARSPMKSGRDYIVIADPAVNEVPFHQLIAWMTEALEA